MKKTAFTFLILLCALMLALPVQAQVWEGLPDQDALWEVPEMNLSLTAPAGYAVFTQNMDEEDPALAAFGLTSEATNEHFSANHIYFNAVHPDGSNEIVVTMTENTISDVSIFTDEQLLQLAEMIGEEYAAMGMPFSEYEIFKHPQMTFLRICFADEAGTVHGIQYYTICNHQAMNFTLRSYAGEPTQEQADMMEKFVESITLGESQAQ